MQLDGMAMNAQVTGSAKQVNQKVLMKQFAAWKSNNFTMVYHGQQECNKSADLNPIIAFIWTVKTILLIHKHGKIPLTLMIKWKSIVLVWIQNIITMIQPVSGKVGKNTEYQYHSQIFTPNSVESKTRLKQFQTICSWQVQWNWLMTVYLYHISPGLDIWVSTTLVHLMMLTLIVMQMVSILGWSIMALQQMSQCKDLLFLESLLLFFGWPKFSSSFPSLLIGLVTILKDYQNNSKKV